ncbi:unnamed protein product [Larinioides sclopetarius]|uniref:Uncharacterized protein n=1 Tax=Larinioides sclopetarius TaxID=280406 RepID=A0AAV1Z2W5_9ARAC
MFPVRGKTCFVLVITWLLGAPCFLGHTQSNDPILKYICSQDIGRQFWKDLMQCNVVLNQEFLLALSTCIPSSTLDEAESTRVYICSCPEKWVKMMDCLNMHLIQLQVRRMTALFTRLFKFSWITRILIWKLGPVQSIENV